MRETGGDRRASLERWDVTVRAERRRVAQMGRGGDTRRRGGRCSGRRPLEKVSTDRRRMEGGEAPMDLVKKACGAQLTQDRGNR
jgi:hypothetical protein